MIDSKLFYVGSENLYPSAGVTAPMSPGVMVNASLHEFGVIAEGDQTIATMVIGEYST